MDVNFIDAIPSDKPHCGNCEYWEDEGELFAKCEKGTGEYCPSFAICDKHVFKKR